MELEVKAAVDSEPDTGLAPDQAPDAVHEVAPVLDHVNTEADPLVTVMGFAENDNVGAGAGGATETFTVTAVLAAPPLPEQVREYVLAAVSAPVDWEPDSDLEPDQAPDAVHDVALLDDQLSVELPPLATVVGLTESETVGAGAGAGGADETLTATAVLAAPPLPEQVREYVLAAVSAPVDWEPDSDLDPDQAPDAVHDVALLDDQLSVELPPLATVVGLTESETVGAEGAGWTSIVVVVVVAPPSPEHVRENVLLAASASVD